MMQPRTQRNPAAGDLADEASLEGHIARVIHRNDDDGFTVLVVQDDHQANHKVVHTGPVPGLGARVICRGQWEQSNYGRQLRARELGRDETYSDTYLADYIGQAGLPQIGQGRARTLVNALGRYTPWYLGHDPERISAITGLTRGQAIKIQRKWNQHKDFHRAHLALRYYGLDRSQANAVMEVFDDAALTRLRQDPYQLTEQVNGIGFRTADAAARRLGVGFGDARRVRAGVLETLAQAAGHGHTGMGARELASEAAKLLELDDDTVAQEIAAMIDAENLVHFAGAEADCIQLARYAYHERRIAECLAARRDHVPPWADKAIDVDAAPGADGLDATQYDALKRILDSHTTLLCGGPGTGKTTLLNCVLSLLEHALPRGIVLAAPTGCAAKRMTQATGRDATTLHRVLDYNPAREGFGHNANNPISADLLVVDEASMIAAREMRALLEATPADTSVLIVGDANQIPSVQPGEVLADLVRSRALTTIELSINHRAGTGSDIPIAATELLEDARLPTASDLSADVAWINVDDDQAITARVVELVRDEIPALRPHIDARRDVQVISPMQNRAAGVRELNRELQQALNPAQPNKSGYRVNDRVMHLVNKPQEDLFNGDIGLVTQVETNGAVTIRFETNTVRLTPRSLGRIKLAYACTVHKAQGSEAPVIVVPLARAHLYMLDRRMLHTAITRAREQVLFVGPRSRIRRRLHYVGVIHRRSTLAERVSIAAKP